MIWIIIVYSLSIFLSFQYGRYRECQKIIPYLEQINNLIDKLRETIRKNHE